MTEPSRPNVFPNQEQIAAANAANNVYQGPTFNSDEERIAAESMARATAEQKAMREAQLILQAKEAAEKATYVAPVAQTNVVVPTLHGNSETQSTRDITPNVPFDVLPLPSEGKIYKNKKSSVKVAYLTASDENILTSPNLIESGEFMNILFSRKLLDKDLNYSDLHVGDRNAIMIWLRSTGYGEIYPVSMINPNTGEEFEADINLSELKVKKLGAEPDGEGYFDFKCPISTTPLKFKLLTVGDLERIEAVLDYEKTTLGSKINNSVTYALEKCIVEVNGERSLDYIKGFIEQMRAGDSKALRNYIEKIESGIDLNITIQVPGGGEPIKTFLPLTRKFFWPDL